MLPINIIAPLFVNIRYLIDVDTEDRLPQNAWQGETRWTM